MSRAQLEDLLGVALPVVQAPMAGVQDGELARAVIAAGGLGSLPCAMLSPTGMRRDVGALMDAVSGPVNVNFFTHAMPAADVAVDGAWAAALAPYYAEFDLDPTVSVSAATRLPFDRKALTVVEELRPAVVSFHFGLPPAELLARVRASGARVIASATTVAEARWLAQRGVDAVVAQGLEAGGHRGHFLDHDLALQSGTFTLLPQIVRAVDVPVIAAGGIADAEGVAAAFALGASGVQVGTAYMRCPEARTSALHRAQLTPENGGRTIVTNVFSGRPARGIVNRCIRELGPLGSAVPPFPLAAARLAPLRSAAEARGSTDFSPLWCGQHIAATPPGSAADLTRMLAAGAVT